MLDAERLRDVKGYDTMYFAGGWTGAALQCWNG